MNGLLADFDSNFLIGRELESISFGTYVLNLHFSRSCLISVESTISLDNGKPTELPESLFLVYRLLNKAVATTSSRSDGTSALQFEGAQKLTIYDSNADYESYNIRAENGILVVV
jgi:hypothetical protein